MKTQKEKSYLLNLSETGTEIESLLFNKGWRINDSNLITIKQMVVDGLGNRFKKEYSRRDNGKVVTAAIDVIQIDLDDKAVFVTRGPLGIQVYWCYTTDIKVDENILVDLF